MKNNNLKALIKHVLVWIETNNLPTSKIAVQKAIFYLQEKGVIQGYNFEPYSYGPFCRQIMETATEMHQTKELIVERTFYKPGSEFHDNINEKQKEDVDKHLEQFVRLLDSDFSFDNLELFGTVLYCLKALQENDLPLDEDILIKEFKAWKGNKYADKSISNVYELLQSDFKCLEACH